VSSDSSYGCRRTGWLGDAQVTAEEAMQNFDMVSVYEEFLNMIQDTQHLNDGDVAPVAPVAVRFKKHRSLLGAWDPHSSLRKPTTVMLVWCRQYGLSLITDVAGAELGSRHPRVQGAMADLSWTAAFPLIAHWLYKYYADTAHIVKHWVSLKKYIDGVHEAASSSKGGLPAFWTWGDW
jgi:hypothetical protein